MMQESEAWTNTKQFCKELLSVVSLLILVLCIWSAIVDLQRQVEKAEVESERRFKSVEQLILEGLDTEWKNQKDSAKQHLESLLLPQQNQ